MGSGLAHFFLMIAEASVVGGLLLGLFHLRSVFGLALLYIALGAFQYMQVVLAASVYVEVLPGLTISPGSVVLFTASLAAILLVYIREDAIEARKLVYGLLMSNIILSLLGVVMGFHLSSSAAVNYLGLPRELFLQSPRVFVIGTIVIVLDIVLVIVFYEAFSTKLQNLFVRIFLTLFTVLSIDSLFFTTGSFFDHPAYRSILISSLIGKTIFAFLYASMLSIYLQRVESKRVERTELGPRTHDLFHTLTYRQRYEVLAAEIVRDPLSGLRNRGFFDDMLPREVEIARRTGKPLTLLMVDIDYFKSINDDHGHAIGDQVIRAFAAVLESATRVSDLVCRFGGEEFAIILPGSDSRNGDRIAESIRTLAPSAAESIPALASRPLTVTVGVATFPHDAESAHDLMVLADQRLYIGKRRGRNCVVAR